VDDRLFLYWARLVGPFAPAIATTTCRHHPRFKDLAPRFPQSEDLATVIADAGEAYDDVLTYVHDELKALRLIDVRQHETGYRRGQRADRARLRCSGQSGVWSRLPAGVNGHDYARGAQQVGVPQLCQHRPQPTSGSTRRLLACRRMSLSDSQHPLGHVVRVGVALPDGCVRLARDLKVDSRLGSCAIIAAATRRSRNANQERHDLTRSPWYGLPNDAKGRLSGRTS